MSLVYSCCAVCQSHRDRIDQVSEMSRMLYSLPPTGAPLRGKDILSGLRGMCGEEDPVPEFEAEVRRYFGVSHAFLLSSGKAALTVALRALSMLSDRREVIIPAFSSFCLPSAVAKSGLRIRLCDVTPETLDFDGDQLRRMVTERTLCIIPVHLFGLPSQVDVIRQIAGSQGAYVIEDAAQAAGGDLNGSKLGAIGDIGIISLGRGKNISTVEGGVILTSSPLVAEKIYGCLEMSLSGKHSVAEQVRTAGKALALSLLLQPRVYWVPERLPFLKLGASEFSTQFEIRGFSRFQAGIGRSVFSQLDSYTEIRRANAAYLMEQLKNVEGLLVPQPLPQSRPAYLRFPVLLKDSAARDLAYRSLAEEGLGASTTYPTALSAVQDLRSYAVGLADTYPGAEWVGDRILTLPTHPYVSHADLERMVEVLRSLPASSGRVRDVQQDLAVSSCSLGEK